VDTSSSTRKKFPKSKTSFLPLNWGQTTTNPRPRIRTVTALAANSPEPQGLPVTSEGSLSRKRGKGGRKRGRSPDDEIIGDEIGPGLIIK